MKGKNFSCNNESGKRNKNDLYSTPKSLTILLLEKEKLKESILEPACGKMAIVDVLKDQGYKDIYFYDIETNFLKENRFFETIITNPPFSLSFEFIVKAKQICNKFIFLYPASYMHGKQRYDKIWMDKSFPLKKIYIFTRYPLLEENIREDGKHKTGMMVYAWYVWERGYIGKPTIDWLDNDPYILRSNKKENLSKLLL